MRFTQILGYALTLSLVACGGAMEPSQSDSSDAQSDGVIPELNPRVTYQGNSLSLNGSSATALSTGTPQAQFKYLVSAAAPKGKNGTLQATNFAFAKQNGFVSYNTAGATVEGALDVVSIKKNQYADIEATLMFSDAEFADVKIDDKYVYLVGAEQTSEHQGAVFVVVDIHNEKKPSYVTRLSLPGYYGTSMVISENTVYVSSADDTGIVAIDVSTPTAPKLKNTYGFRNALSVTTLNNVLYTLGGESSTAIYSGTKFDAHWSITNSRSEAPSRMIGSGQYIYTNAQYSGLSVFDVSASKISFNVKLDGTGNGIDACGSYIFLAQGEAGLQVMQFNQKTTPTSLGTINFPDERGSANQVSYSDDDSVIFLADGLGGFRVISFTPPADK